MEENQLTTADDNRTKRATGGDAFSATLSCVVHRIGGVATSATIWRAVRTETKENQKKTR